MIILLVVAVVGVCVLASALWWRLHPSACPYSQRFWVSIPHPFITPKRLLSILAPESRERHLEIGPGTGFYSLTVAEHMAPNGTLELLDIQQEMLDHTMHRAAKANVSNLVPRQGDARRLPYEDGRFDGAFLVTTLGEIPDQAAALREFARVVRGGGRLIVGELFGDPHWVRPATVRRRAEVAGWRYEQQSGPPFACFTSFVLPAKK